MARTPVRNVFDAYSAMSVRERLAFMTAWADSEQAFSVNDIRRAKRLLNQNGIAADDPRAPEALRPLTLNDISTADFDTTDVSQDLL